MQYNKSLKTHDVHIQDGMNEIHKKLHNHNEIFIIHDVCMY